MSSGDQDNRGRKPRSYYVDYSGKRNNRWGNNRRNESRPSGNARYREAPEISFGHRGFLITSVDEVKSYLEMRNILEGYNEQLYFGATQGAAGDEEAPGEPAQGKLTTTEDELESELKQLRANRPFKQMKTNCRNTLFIKIMDEFAHIDPVLLVNKFFDDLASTRQLQTSNTFKVLPILDTFRNSVACAKESVANLLDTKFKDDTEEKKFFIEFQSRGNYKLNPEEKQKMIESVADVITTHKPNWKVDRESADYMVILVALRHVGCIGILPSYFQRAKYNVIEFCKEFNPTGSEHASIEENDDNQESSETVGESLVQQDDHRD